MYLLTLTILTQPREQNLYADAGGVLKSFAKSQGSTCVGVSFFTKLQAFRPATLLKRDSFLHRCFPVKFEKF